jgi:hypothetical protein
MKLFAEVIKVRKEHVEFLLDVMMWYPVSEGWMLFCFAYMVPDLMFEVVNIDKLDMKLVVKVLDTL